MIIAFDGNVFAGKTTLIGYLIRKIRCRRIAEHAFFVNRIKKEKKYPPTFSEHLRYLHADRLRIKMMGRRVNLLDRSFVSLSAHIYALYLSSGIDLRGKHLRALRRLLRRKKIIIPNLYVFVSCEWEAAQKRFLADRHDGGRGTPDIFMEKKYFFAVEKFNLLWQKNLSSGCVARPWKASYCRLEEMITASTKKKNGGMSSAEIIGLMEKIFFQ